MPGAKISIQKTAVVIYSKGLLLFMSIVGIVSKETGAASVGN